MNILKDEKRILAHCQGCDTDLFHASEIRQFGLGEYCEPCYTELQPFCSQCNTQITDNLGDEFITIYLCTKCVDLRHCHKCETEVYQDDDGSIDHEDGMRYCIPCYAELFGIAN